MNKKKIVLFGLIYLLVLVAAVLLFVGLKPISQEYSIKSPSESVGGVCYLVQDDDEGDFICAVAEDGSVTAVYNCGLIDGKTNVISLSAGKNTAGENEIYVLLHGVRKSGEETRNTYQVLRLDEQLSLLAKTDAFALSMDGSVADMMVDGQDVSLAQVASDGQNAMMYKVGADRFTDVEEEAGQESEAKEGESSEETAKPLEVINASESLNLGSGNFITDAVFTSEGVSLRTDVGGAAQSEVVSDTAKARSEKMHFSFSQRFGLLQNETFILFAAGLIFLVLVFGIWRVIAKSKRFIFTGIAVEFVLLLLFVGVGAWSYQHTIDTAKSEYQRFARYTLENLVDTIAPEELGTSAEDTYYESEAYIGLHNKLAGAALHTGTQNVFYDIFAVRLQDMQVIASAGGRTGFDLAELATADAEEIAQKASEGGGSQLSTVTIRGNSYGIVCTGVSAGMGATPAYALVALTNQGTVSSAEKSSAYQVLGALAIVFLIGSAIIWAILLLHANEFSEIVKALLSIAGRPDYNFEKPKAVSGDLEKVWNAIAEIDRSMRRVRYSRSQMYEAYYRFAPKQVEKLLQKDSITEVESGNMVTKQGTIAVIADKQMKMAGSLNFSGHAGRGVEQMNALLEVIASYQEQERGTMISHNRDLSALQLLFFDEKTDSLEFGKDLVSAIEKRQAQANIGNFSALMHYTDYVYGVVGDREQSSTFLLSEEIDELEKYGSWLLEMGLYLVVTESVVKRENLSQDLLRCIGQVDIKSTGRTEKMYEVLMVCPERELSDKLRTKERFAEALELYYQHNFFLARSSFTEILKESPLDHITKWYLFTCERCLNDANPNRISLTLNQALETQ